MQTVMIDPKELNRRTATARKSSRRAIEDLERCVDLFGDVIAPDGRASAADPTADAPGDDRSFQLKIGVKDCERFLIDRLANAMSEAARTRVASNNILRAALILILACEGEIIELARASGIRRPENRDSDGLDDFEREIAKIIARAAARSELAAVRD